jgi:hypothetical protein
MLHAVLLHRENVVDRLARPLAIVLIAGAALLGVGAALHPVLSGNGAQDLQLIASTPHWRTIHLVMLAGSGLIVLGLWVRVVDRPEIQPSLVAALAVIAVGLAINALNIAYMAGSGTHLAEMFKAGRPGMSDLFEVTHPIGLMAARFGNFLVALGASALGFVEWNDPTRPRWLAWLAWGAALGGFVGVIFFNEASRVALAAVALLSGWELATAGRALAK